jgi:hypothetical protein
MARTIVISVRRADLPLSVGKIRALPAVGISIMKAAERGAKMARKQGPLWLSRALLLVLAVTAAAATKAQDADQSATNPLIDLARKVKLLPEPVEPKDFVKQTRPAQTDYLPVGVLPPERELKVKTPDELKAMEAELDTARARHDKISGRPAPKLKPPAKPAPVQIAR